MPATANTQNKTPQEQFALKAQIRMLELKLSVTALAKEMGLNRNTVSQAIHHGLHHPTLTKIATRLGIPL